MKRKLIYTVLFLLVLAGIGGPVVYTNKIAVHNQAKESSLSGETAGPAAGGQTSPIKNTAENGEPKTAAATGITGQTNIPQTYGAPATGDGDPPDRKPDGAPPAGAGESGFTIGIAVVGMDGELLYGPGNVTVTKKNMWDVSSLGALDATGLPYTMSTRWPGFVEAVAGQRNKGQSGWMYMVNGEIPMVSAGQKAVKTGDKVIWWYSKSMGDPSPDWDDLIKRGVP